MRHKIYYFILLAIFIIFAFCSKTAEQKEIKEETKDVAKKVKKKSNRVILEINESKYHEDDFRTFLNLNSRSFSEFKNRDKIYSYIFKKYIIQRMLLYKAKVDNFNFNKETLLENIKTIFEIIPEKDKKELLNAEMAKTYLNEILYSRIKIKAQEIRKYYMDNKDKYRRKAEAHLYEIMVKDKNKANEIRAILNTEPHKFAEIAKKESESRIAKEDGSHGFIEIDTFPETFRKFIKSVSINKVTPVVELLYGEINGKKIYTYHIFKVTKRKRKRLLFLSKVKESIKKELILQKKENIYNEFLKDLSNSFSITVITKNLFFKYKKI